MKFAIKEMDIFLPFSVYVKTGKELAREHVTLNTTIGMSLGMRLTH